MKIKNVKTFVIDSFRTNWVIAKVYTDEGVTGLGEGSVGRQEKAVTEAIMSFSNYLIGKDPFKIEHHLEVMTRDSYWRTGVILRSALSALEAAMFDIKGKALGVPVYELLGGSCRDKIPCYANAWFTGAKTAEAFAEKAVNACSAGFRSLKWDPFGKAYLELDSAGIEDACNIIGSVRSAVGNSVDLLIEGHGRFNVPTAKRVGHRITEFFPKWFEEPVPPEHIGALADVRQSIPTPIAAGERYYDKHRFAELIEQNAVDYIQPDVCHVGGLIEVKKIAALAQMHYLGIAPHNPIGPVGNAMTLQLAACIPNFVMLETMMMDVPWRKEVFQEDLEIVDGQMIIPNKPGLGIDFNEAAAEKYPYKYHPLRHYSGDLTDIRPPDERPWYKIRKSANE